MPIKDIWHSNAERATDDPSRSCLATGGGYVTVEPMGQRGRRFEYLDLLRLVCASAVVLLHYGVMAPYTGVLPARYYFAPNVLVYGQFGVHIFFIISGFVITLSARGRTAGAFLWARFLRLYPAY